jgi:Fe-S cluster biogenesis protein NfuA
MWMETPSRSAEGMCASCAASQFNLKDYVEKKLQEFVTSDLMVVEVKQ